MQLRNGTKKENRTVLAEIAGEAFAEHKIVQEQINGPVQMWYCGKVGTGMYSFRVISAPNVLLVYGDVGDYMLQASDRNLVPWLRGAIKSEQYLISKMINKGEVFLPDEAVNLLDELYKECEEREDSEERARLEKVRDDWDHDYDGFDRLGETFMSADLPTELIDCTVDYESNVYWTVECLKKFIELLDNNLGFNRG